ncbi:MAG TPA: hypothetical protein VKH18_12690 [Terriglobales bacterium]|nr:hypothetical protein [Terriglobales bacterium]
MKIKTITWIIMLVMSAALALSVQMAAQDKAKQHHPHQYHHYQISDPGTFGGPGDYLQLPPAPRAGVLNNRGTLVGAADTTTPDPYCGFGPPCYAGHAFQLQDGVTTDLGRLPGGFDSQVNWISESGAMTGPGDNGQPDPLPPFPLPQIHAILWDHGSMTDLGTLPGGYFSYSNGVNSRGEVVGAAQNTVPDPNSMLWLGTQTRAFYWNGGTIQDIGTLPGGTDAQAALINERGQVAGWSYTNSTPSAICAGFYNYGFFLTTGSFIWDKENGVRDIGGLGGTCTLAMDLNNQGQVVGLSAIPGDVNLHPFDWEAGNGMTDLLAGSPGATAYWQVTINQNGVVASGEQDALGRWHSLLWRKTGGKWKKMDIGFDSVPTSINESEQVIGYGSIPFLWEEGGVMVDLNTLVPPNSGIQLYETGNINDLGEIAVQGPDANGNNHAVLLIPCDDNHRDVEGCDYSMVDASEVASRPSPAVSGAASRALPQSPLRRMNRYHLPGLGVSRPE